MKSTSEIKEVIDVLRDEMDAIIAKAEDEDRDLTAEETAQFNDIHDRIAANQKKLDTAAKIEAERMARAADVFSKHPELARRNPSAGWAKDSRGRGFAILAKNDKATDLLKPQAENEFGHFIVAKLFGANGMTPASIRAELAEGTNTLGGFMVPDRLSGEVIDLARAKSVLMQAGTRTVLMDSDNLTVPKLESDVTIATKSENAAFTPSDVTFGARQLHTHTAGALVKLSRELAEDAPGLVAEQLTRFMGSAMATKVDLWGLAGIGSAEPLGILTRSEIDDTGSVGAIDWLDVAAAATSVRNANHEPNSVIMNTEIYSDLFNAETGDGTNAARGWLNAPPTLANVNFLQTTNCPLAKLIIGDFSRYLMGVRTRASVEASTQAGEAFEKHQVWVKITMRFDFVTLDDTAFHILTGITS